MLFFPPLPRAPSPSPRPQSEWTATAEEVVDRCLDKAHEKRPSIKRLVHIFRAMRARELLLRDLTVQLFAAPGGSFPYEAVDVDVLAKMLAQLEADL